MLKENAEQSSPENNDFKKRMAEIALNITILAILKTERFDSHTALRLGINYTAYYADYELYLGDISDRENEAGNLNWHNPTMRAKSEEALINASVKGDFSKLRAFLLREAETSWVNPDINRQFFKLISVLPLIGKPISTPTPAWMDKEIIDTDSDSVRG